MKRGFTLAELMVAAAILAFVLSGLLLLFANCIFLNQVSRDLTRAYSAIEAKMEELKAVGFSGIDVYNGITFDLAGFESGDSKGKIEVVCQPLGADPCRLKKLRIAASFKSRERVVGEDKDFDFALDSGEDINGNNTLDFPAELATYITE